jgi:hypothetical protein
MSLAQEFTDVLRRAAQDPSRLVRELQSQGGVGLGILALDVDPSSGNVTQRVADELERAARQLREQGNVKQTLRNLARGIETAAGAD